MRTSIRSISAAVSGVIAVTAMTLTTVAAACSTEKAPADTAAVVPVATAARAPTYTYEVVASYPHDTGAYTEGLLWHEGHLFESTGQKGESNIREVDLKTGHVIRQHNIDAKYFGEGIIIFGEKMYELTWQDNVGFIYDWKTFALKSQFTYEGEGWAFTTDGKSLIMSNGSSVIAFRDPATFKVTGAITVTDHGTPVPKLNELEWIKGEIWANVWETDQIARIDPATGHVLGWIDLAGILPAADRRGKEEVLNGIAYDAKNDRIFVTGKYWAKLFEIKVKPRS
ncbi:MAG: glutaminyl-peptide cyclotransferase [Gemmatimonadota bacterium]|nr:glutaminyl-peptide cyclotransferase [Gemmatimonadota bacterium]